MDKSGDGDIGPEELMYGYNKIISSDSSLINLEEAKKIIDRVDYDDKNS